VLKTVWSLKLSCVVLHQTESESYPWNKHLGQLFNTDTNTPTTHIKAIFTLTKD